jgi:hypothetical protein
MLEKLGLRMGVDETGSGLGPVTGFGIRGVEPSSSDPHCWLVSYNLYLRSPIRLHGVVRS